MGWGNHPRVRGQCGQNKGASKGTAWAESGACHAGIVEEATQEGWRTGWGGTGLMFWLVVFGLGLTASDKNASSLKTIEIISFLHKGQLCNPGLAWILLAGSQASSILLLPRGQEGTSYSFFKKGTQKKAKIVWVLTLKTGLLGSYPGTDLLPPLSRDHSQLQGSLGNVVFVLANYHRATKDGIK